MTHQPELWEAIRRLLPHTEWMPLDDIYKAVEKQVRLDREDFEPAAPGLDEPRWKRNVRNVLQYRKGTGDILWNSDAAYKI